MAAPKIAKVDYRPIDVVAAGCDEPARLAGAVLAKALDDARWNREDARAFLTEESEDLWFWCMMAALDMDDVIVLARRRLASDEE
jgi:hypothetical protein